MRLYPLAMFSTKNTKVYDNSIEVMVLSLEVQVILTVWVGVVASLVFRENAGVVGSHVMLVRVWVGSDSP